MKSILIISPWLGLVDRGAETFAKELANNLAVKMNVTIITGGEFTECGQNIEVINLSGFKKYWYVLLADYIYKILSNYSSLKYAGFPFKCLKVLVDKIYYLHPEVLYQYSFMRYFSKSNEAKRKWDVIFPQNGIMGILWANKQRKKNNALIIYTGHGGIGRGEELILNSRPDLYVCISSLAEKWAKEKCSNVVYIPNGVNTDLFIPVAKENSNEIRILSVGALTEFKRHELTIRAVHHIKNGVLTIIGAGEQYEKLRALCEKLLPGRYSIQAIPYSKMPSAYLNKDIFVLPSLNEPMGIVYLEALASGLKLVVPNDEVRREILSNFGFYSDVNDELKYAQDIVKASIAFQDNQAAYEYIVDKYSWRNISMKYSDAIERKLKKKEISL